LLLAVPVSRSQSTPLASVGLPYFVRFPAIYANDRKKKLHALLN
jgi:hypothetical protein